jgi:hypothetical protein
MLLLGADWLNQPQWDFATSNIYSVRLLASKRKSLSQGHPIVVINNLRADDLDDKAREGVLIREQKQSSYSSSSWLSETSNARRQ